MNEIDGLRIISSEKTFLLERVQEKTLTAFKVGSLEPSAIIIQAQKSADLNQPKADSLINSLGPDKLVIGIEDLLEIASNEHTNVPIMKHLLRTASFAKTFPEAEEFDSKKYVGAEKTIQVLIKIRNSKNCSRAITFKQYEKLGANNLLKLLLKYRDHFLALKMTEHLSNLKQYVPLVYSDWCETMIKHSKESEDVLLKKVREKFDMLKIRIAEERGMNVWLLQYNLQGEQLSPEQRQKLEQGKTEEAIDTISIVAKQIPEYIKLNIDFAKLAWLAHSDKK